MIDIFKRWFSHTKEQYIDDSQNPWAGLASYEDPETAERKLKFCGRDDDSYDLARLIMGNVFVTLYGKSGIGKTSLLNAGVFPELREEQYTPVSIRLGMRDEVHPQSYQTMIVEAVERVVKRIDSINVIEEQQDQQSIDYLWNYFARHRFHDKYDEPTTPTIVFDQFEEVFRGYCNEAETLLRQLDYLNDKDHSLDNCEVDGQPYRYEQNFRFVVSIREDDLYRLEDSIDNCYLPALKRCRYRLRSLSEDGARDAILLPGEGLFNPDEKDSIAEAIIGKSRNDDGSISTNIISLLCSRIYVEFKKSGVDHISPSLVENFLKGNPFERFYNEATKGFSNKEKSYIEDNFVDSTGRRNSIPESNFLLHVKNGSKLLEGKNRILQRISTSSDGKNNRVELIHDSFCEPLATLKKKRERHRLIGGFVIIFFTVFALFIIGIYFYMMLNENRLQGRTIEIQKSTIHFQQLEFTRNLKLKNDSLLDALKIAKEESERKDLAYKSLSSLNNQLENAQLLLKKKNLQLMNKEQELIDSIQELQKERRKVIDYKNKYNELNNLIDNMFATSHENPSNNDHSSEKLLDDNATYKQNSSMWLTDKDKKLNKQIEEAKGHLLVPIAGSYYISQHFGKRIGATTIEHSGISLIGKKGAYARSIFNGEVVSVFSLSESINILIRHGSYISVYCNLVSTEVHRGQHVRAGEKLGKIGIDNDGEIVLYFQLRYETEKLNPEEWLSIVKNSE